MVALTSEQVEQFHREEGGAVVELTAVDDLDYVLAPQTRDRGGFATEAPRGALAVELGAQHLDRELAAEPQVLCFEDVAAGASTDTPPEAVRIGDHGALEASTESLRRARLVLGSLPAEADRAGHPRSTLVPFCG